MFLDKKHRYNDVELVMNALRNDPLQLISVLITFGGTLRSDLATAIREIVATRAWQSDHLPRRTNDDSFSRFWHRDLADRRNQGPKREHVDAALATFPETRATLYRSWAADCPQHCLTFDEHSHFWSEKHIEDYRQALFGWYAAIQYAHQALASALEWYSRTADTDSSEMPFLEVICRSPYEGHGNSKWVRDKLTDLLLMMQAWSPYTFEAIEAALRTDHGSFRSWSAGFEAAGRQEAAAVADALATSLNPTERGLTLSILEDLQQIFDIDDHDLAQQLPPQPCESRLHQRYGTDTSREQMACAHARITVYKVATAPWNEQEDHHQAAQELADLLLGNESRRFGTLMERCRTSIAKDSVQLAPKIWRDHADALHEVRLRIGISDTRASSAVDVQKATLERFESGIGKLPGTPSALRYLILIISECLLNDIEAPDYVPEAIRSSVAAILQRSGDTNRVTPER